MKFLKTWFGKTVLFAFASFISFCQINSYQADKSNANTAWWILGIVAGLAAVYCLIKTKQNSN